MANPLTESYKVAGKALKGWHLVAIGVGGLFLLSRYKKQQAASQTAQDQTQPTDFNPPAGTPGPAGPPGPPGPPGQAPCPPGWLRGKTGHCFNPHRHKPPPKRKGRDRNPAPVMAREFAPGRPVSSGPTAEPVLPVKRGRTTWERATFHRPRPLVSGTKQ